MLELKTVLRDEYTALNVLDQALKKDDGNVDTASAVQKIVKYLPEKHRDGLLKVSENHRAGMRVNYRYPIDSNIFRKSFIKHESNSNPRHMARGTWDIFEEKKRGL
jgi:hypothetical protein